MSKVLILDKEFGRYWAGPGRGMVDEKAMAFQYDSDGEWAKYASKSDYLFVEPVEDKVLIRNCRGKYWNSYGAGLAVDRASAHHFDRKDAERTALLIGVTIEEIEPADTRPLAEQLAGAREVLVEMDKIIAALLADIAEKEERIVSLKAAIWGAVDRANKAEARNAAARAALVKEAA